MSPPAAVRLRPRDWCAVASPAIDRPVRLRRALCARGAPVHARARLDVESLPTGKAAT